MIKFLKSWTNLNPLGVPGSTKTRYPLSATLCHNDLAKWSLYSLFINSSKTNPQYTKSNKFRF